MWLGLSKKNNVKISGKVPKSGFVPGEKIPLEITINNKSSVDIVEITADLVVKSTCKTRKTFRTQYRHKTIVTASKKDLKGVKGNIFVSLSLEIPPAPTSTYGLCEILDLDYFVDAAVKFAGPHRSSALTFPLLIGTIPIGVSSSQKSNEINFEDLGICKYFISYFTVKKVHFYLPAPPTYEQATFVDTVNLSELSENSIGNDNFTPLYPKYSLKS